MRRRSKIIAIIDDETRHVDFYIRAIESIGYSAKHFNSPASCLNAINSGSSFSIYIVDLMMPPGDIYSIEDSQGGILTGALLACDLRKQDALTPIIILTNMNIGSIFHEVDTMISDLNNIFILRKADFAPLKLAQSVGALLEKGISPVRREGILKCFLNSLILKPNFLGFGIDIKKIFPGGNDKSSE